MSKYRVVICAGALVAVGIHFAASPNAAGKLTSAEMASIRGAAPPNGCQENKKFDCYPGNEDYDSTCQACLTASQNTLASGTFYPSPGTCAAAGTAGRLRHTG